MHSSAQVRSALIAAGLVAAVAMMAGPAAQAAEPTPEASAIALRDQATAAFDAGRYSEAARLFLEAYVSFPNGWLLYNAARAQHNGGDLKGALDSYRLFIGSPESDAEYRGRASQYIIEIEQELHPPAPEVPDKPAVVGPKTPAGLYPDSGVGDATQVKVSATKPAVSPPGRAKRVAGWTLTAMGAGLAVTAAALHLAANTTRDDIRSDTGGGGVVDASVLTQREALDAAARADRRELWSGITLGVGVAAVVTGVVLIIRGKPARSPQVGVSPLPGGAVAGLRGSF